MVLTPDTLGAETVCQEILLDFNDGWVGSEYYDLPSSSPPNNIVNKD